MKFFTKTLLTIILSLILFQANAQILGGLNFNGDDNYIEVINSPLNEINDGNFTFEVWMRGEASEQGAHPMIFSNRGDSAFGGGMAFFLHNQWGGSQSKLLAFQVDAVNYKVANNGSFNGNLFDNECHHLAVSRYGNTLSFFIDGILIGVTTPSNLGSVSFNGPLLIGKDKSTNNTFNGTISQCRIWNVERSQREINENKDISLQGDETGLLAYWEMDNGNSQLVSDKTGQFDGSLGSSDQVDDQDPLWSDEGCVQFSSVSTNNSIAPSFKLSPNPTAGLLIIENNGIEDFQIRITDQIGRLLLIKNMNAATSNIDISDYSNGVYFLSVNYNGQMSTQKIIKI